MFLLHKILVFPSEKSPPFLSYSPPVATSPSPPNPSTTYICDNPESTTNNDLLPRHPRVPCDIRECLCVVTGFINGKVVVVQKDPLSDGYHVLVGVINIVRAHRPKRIQSCVSIESV